MVTPSMENKTLFQMKTSNVHRHIIVMMGVANTLGSDKLNKLI